MANRKSGSPESALHILESRVTIIKGNDVKQRVEMLLPQRVEDGKMYNFKDQVIMTFNGEDCIFHENANIVQETNRVTDKFISTILAPIKTYLNVDITSENGPGPDDIEEELETAKDIDLVSEVSDLIKAGEMKKAKKVLKANKDNSSYKEAKKLFDAPVEETTEDEVVETKDELNLIEQVEELIADSKLKVAKKLLKANPDHADFKAAKKLIKKAGK